MSGVGPRIRTERKRQGMRLNALARAAEISPSYLSQLERGEREAPSAEVLYRIAGALGKPVGELLEHEFDVTDLGQLPDNLPATLRQFVRKRAAALGLVADDVRMLANLRYRGRQPATVEDWEDLLRFIRRAIR